MPGEDRRFLGQNLDTGVLEYEPGLLSTPTATLGYHTVTRRT